VRLSPEYEGIETGMGIEVIFKCIGKSFGVPKKEIKLEF
jgi:hypothetical protein